jgi:hypothetical protein
MEEVRIQWEMSERQDEAYRYLNDDVTSEILFGGGAGGGKTYLGCSWALMLCLKYPGVRGLIGRAKLKTLKKTTGKTLFEVMRKEWKLVADEDYFYNDQKSEIKFANGSEILFQDLFLYPSDPEFDELGSLEISFAFLDEVSQIIKRVKEVIKSRIRYRLDEYGLSPKLLMSCNPGKGFPYTDFYKPYKNKMLPENKKFVKSLVGDNPFISKHYIKNLRSIDDKKIKARLLFGDWEFDDDPSALLTLEAITDLFTNKAKQSEEGYISGDVSRKGNDKMPIIYWEGLQAKEIHIIPKEIRKDTKKSASFIVQLAEKKGVRRSHIVLDDDGVGGGVVDQVRGCVGFVNNSSPIKPPKWDSEKKNKPLNYANLKTQCAYKFAELAEKGKIGIDDPDDSQIREDISEELEQLKEGGFETEGKLRLTKKEKVKELIGRSPDYSDTLIMRMIFEIKRDFTTKPKIRVL